MMMSLPAASGCAYKCYLYLYLPHAFLVIDGFGDDRLNKKRPYYDITACCSQCFTAQAVINSTLGSVAGSKLSI